MTVAIEIPDNVSRACRETGNDLSQRAVEALAADLYRSGIITAHAVQEMLHHSSRWETEAFLKRSAAFLDYTEADLESDIATLQKR